MALLDASRDNHFIKDGRADVVALVNMNEEQGWGYLVAGADVLDPHRIILIQSTEGLGGCPITTTGAS
ncbi:hypothetical protein SLE2022_054600 [Rubroshorea leprosula]